MDRYFSRYFSNRVPIILSSRYIALKAALLLHLWNTGRPISSIDDKARARKQSRSAGQWSRIPINPNGICKSATNGGKERALRGRGEKERIYPYEQWNFTRGWWNRGWTDFKIVDAMGECALSRSQFFVSGCILSKTRLFSQREGLFYRRERERKRERKSDRIRSSGVLDGFSPSWWNFKKEKNAITSTRIINEISRVSTNLR